jgi:hypothetical protein
VTNPPRALTILTLAGAVVVGGTASPALAAVSYKNCTQLHNSYPHGIGRSNATDHVRGSTKPVTTWKRDTKGYNLAFSRNKSLDADRDGIACEKK